MERFDSDQKLLAGNATAHDQNRAAGPAREGTALLQGLTICGRCGNRMTVRYHTRRGVEVPDYQCMRACIQDGGRRCQGVPGADVDAAVGRLLLDTMTPPALEAALTVHSELQQRADEADAMRRQQVQRANQLVALARRRYLAVDPDNRPVADSLEADWNDGLRALQAAQDHYDNTITTSNSMEPPRGDRSWLPIGDYPYDEYRRSYGRDRVLVGSPSWKPSLRSSTWLTRSWIRSTRPDGLARTHDRDVRSWPPVERPSLGAAADVVGCGRSRR